MTWPTIAATHIGHRAVLRSIDSFECMDCRHKLVIPLRSDLAATPTPPPFEIDTSNVATPEQVAYRKREALAALEAARQRRTVQATTEEPA